MCLGGGLHFSKHARRMFPRSTAFVGFALWDPYRLEQFAIAPEFDLFYTQDPQTLSGFYAGRGIAAKRCDPLPPLKAAPECDILYREVDAVPQYFCSRPSPRTSSAARPRLHGERAGALHRGRR